MLAFSGFVTTAGADNTVTYTATQTIPVPPASNYAGAGGGDGWAVALTPTAVYNVFHHSGSLTVSCHLQSDASPCWSGNFGATRTITQTVSDHTSNFATSGQPGLYLDQPTGHLYLYATRTFDQTGGVVCVDTVAAPTTANPFCGFTQLSGTGESPVSGNSYLSNGVVVGTHFLAFNYFNGAGAAAGNAKTENTLLCFDTATFAACGGQPFTVNLGGGSVITGDFPSPSVVAIGNQVIVPANTSNGAELGCLDGSTLGACPGSWPAAAPSGYPSSYGAAFPLMNADGGITGLCLPSPNAPCYSLAGASVATPSGLAAAIVPTANDGWNGPAFVLGPRVYVANGNTNQVHCFDYNLGQSCANFPKSFSNLGYLYTVNSDPQRPACIWVNADNGSQQIQNFDAFTGGGCGQGPIRVLASSSVVATPLCTPGSWKSLQVTSPAPGSYTSGSIGFQDSSGRPIPGADDVPLDASGKANLSGLDLSKGAGLPQFLITLNGTQGAPGAVTVNLVWTGTPDPSCATKPGTSFVGGPSTPGVPPKADVKVTLSSPTQSRTNNSVTFTATIVNNGPDTATGVIVRVPVPAGSKLISVLATTGNGCTGGAVATCYIGTLAKGQTAVMTIVLSSPNATTLNVAATAESDYDPNHADNIASSSTTILNPGQVPPPPPPSATPGTFNAVGTGTILVNGVAVPSDQLFVLKSGDIVDVTNGIITFTDSNGQYGSFSSTQFVVRRTAGVRAAATSSADNVLARFQVTQTPGSPTQLTLVDGDFTVCNTPRSLAAKNQTPVRQLWGSAKGSFTTKGRYSAATVRGTIWFVQDRCDGTMTQVTQGVVDVADTTANKTVSVSAGQSYLALPPVVRAAFRPPASTPHQTPAQVTKRGLIWGTQIFKTRKGFTLYLTKRGQAWSQFAAAFPKLAVALTKRH